MKLEEAIADIADGLATIDAKGVPFRTFQPGVGPYGEPKLVKLVTEYLNQFPKYRGAVRTKRTPDLLIPNEWAMEFKIARPFGDNGREAENWSVNLLHPYKGNVSLIGDCLKLQRLGGPERKGAIIAGYEHTPPRIALAPLLDAFELVVTKVPGVRISPRVQIARAGLSHPVHQQVLIAAWEVPGYRLRAQRRSGMARPSYVHQPFPPEFHSFST